MKKIFLLGVFSLLAIGCQQTNQKETRPNIIFILADDLGYDDLSFYREKFGEESEFEPTSQTPNIDLLAKEGKYFSDFYCGAAVCSPSRAVLLTGRNNARLGIYNWIPPKVPMHLEESEITTAEILKEANYNTGHFGKWHLTSNDMPQPEPLDQGFDYAFWTHNNAIPSHKNPVNFIRNREELGELKGYSCDLVVDETMNWLNKHKDDKEPFFANVWFHEAHQVEAAPDSLKQRHQRNKAYYGCIENMDYAVGRLMKYLKDNKLDENTLILFSSDNGSEKLGSNIPFRGEKCFQYEGGIRVPFIAVWPNKIEPNSSSDFTGFFGDVLPSIAQIAQVSKPEDRKIDGIDITDVLLGKKETIEREQPLFFYRYFHDPICMLREGDMVLLGYQNPPEPRKEDYDHVEEALFKPQKGEGKWSAWSFDKSHMDALMLQEPKYFELYNITQDKGQRYNIDSKHPQQLERMKETMLKLKDEMVSEGGDWFKE
jgi:arylsulfatase A